MSLPAIPCHSPSTFSNCASDERGYWKIRVRQDTAENWAKNDPVLASGEFGYVIGSANPGQLLKIGDGTLRWSQLPWLMATGNSGPPGPVGPPGGNMALTIQANEPAVAPLGDLWLQPVSASSANLFISNGFDWISAGSAGGAAGTIDTTAFSYGNPPYTGGATYIPPNSIAANPSPAYPLQEYINRLEAALRSGQIANSGSSTALWRLTVGSSVTIGGLLSVAGGIRYGGTLGPITRADEEPEYTGGFELPPPTQDGYLRADADDNNWYFHDPVIVSDTQPPEPPVVGTLWVYPDGTAPSENFSFVNPPVYADAPIVEQPNGLSIGLSPDGQEIHQPYMVGGVKVLVGGKAYLLPLLEAPAFAPGSEPTPLFTYDDDPITQQLNGTIIGMNADGTEITQPYMVGGIAVIVQGKRYLLPVIEE